MSRVAQEPGTHGIQPPQRLNQGMKRRGNSPHLLAIIMEQQTALLLRHAALVVPVPSFTSPLEGALAALGASSVPAHIVAQLLQPRVVRRSCHLHQL